MKTPGRGTEIDLLRQEFERAVAGLAPRPSYFTHRRQPSLALDASKQPAGLGAQADLSEVKETRDGGPTSQLALLD